MKLSTAIASTALLTGCSTMGNVEASKPFSKEVVMACEPGDREIVHVRQLHRAEGDALVKPLISSSQREIYSYLMSLSGQTDSKVKVIVEGIVLDNYSPSQFEYTYRYLSTRRKVRKKISASVAQRESMYQKSEWGRSVIDFFEFKTKQCGLLSYTYQQCFNVFSDYDSEVFDLFVATFPDENSWDSSDRERHLQSVVDQKIESYDRSMGSASLLGSQERKLVEAEIARDPYVGGGAFKCAVEGYCEILPGETIASNQAVDFAEASFGDGSAQYLAAQEVRDDEVLDIADKMWPASQGFMPVVYGGAHSFSENIEAWNSQNPSKPSFCLSEVDAVAGPFGDFRMKAPQ